MDTQSLLLQAIHASPGDELAWLALADWLEEQAQPDRAELMRLVLALTRAPGGKGRAAREARLQALVDAGARPLLPSRTTSIGLELVLLPPGSFRMGAAPGEPSYSDYEGPQHKVTLTRGFYLAVHPVTRAQWHQVMGGEPAPRRGTRRPAEHVSWNDCHDFCRRLSEREGRPFRLPTEAEWEYACRAGTSTVYFSGAGVEALRKIGWCNYEGPDDRSKSARPVGSYRPNAFGIFDMHGNVWEWCEDGFTRYSREACVDPCPGPGDRSHVVRGGSWRFSPEYCRSGYRGGVVPTERRTGWGCRIALSSA